uniref:NADH-ubiquinone oxidoreductase chain 4L n=1 Tax=Alicella gigantea TaxID=1315966 RepID=A0A5B7KZC8_9CRUS|nr:NADH dehydrogenase subunit 4L [Alicella gigantea]QAT19469.1 NADH dehydrogenase subunit 4L [Alicella gigantea]
MMSQSWLVSVLILMSGIISFVLNQGHLLNSLLSLEMIAVGVYMTLSWIFIGLGYEVYYSLYFLIMVVCEGAMGLSLLVIMSFSHGSDYMDSFGMLVW